MDVGLVQTKWVEGGGSSSESWRREREVGVLLGMGYTAMIGIFQNG